MQKHTTFLEECKLALQNDATLVLWVRCEIMYSGRAESHLASGDRLIIIKSDKTILVHQPKGSSPINYMKAGCEHTLEPVEGTDAFILHSRQGKEYLDVFIEQVYDLSTKKLEDHATLQLVGSERDMSDMLYHNPELIEKGFTPLSREEHTKYGFIDVFGYDKKGILVVVECKRYMGDLAAVTQLRRYVEKIKASKGLATVRGILACPAITPNAKKMLEDWKFSYVHVHPPKYLEKHRKSQMKLGEY
ncbi:MAG: endonuclease NucS [archaeon]